MHSQPLARRRVAALGLILAVCFAHGSSGEAGTQRSVILHDDFEPATPHPWTIDYALTGTKIEGLWVYGDPIGTTYSGAPAQPELPYAGAGCAFTGQNPTGTYGNGDVDNGRVFMFSAPLALAGYSSVEFSYVRWYFSNNASIASCYFAVQARASISDTWVDIERLQAPAAAWTPRTVLLEQFVALTDTVQVQFIASDAPASLVTVEAAVDDVLVTGVGSDICTSEEDCEPSQYCSPEGACIEYGNGDFDGDADVDLVDFSAFQGCFGQVAGETCAAANLTGSALVDVNDYAAFSVQLDMLR